MICVEWWCFEAIILLAGRLPQPEVAIDIVGICVNVATTTFMIPFGLSGELCTCTCSFLPLNRGACSATTVQRCCNHMAG